MTSPDITYTLSQEPPDWRGWTILQVSAHLGEEKVGYVKASWIPRATFNELYPTIWHYLKEMEGKTALVLDQGDRTLWRSFKAYDGGASLEGGLTDDEIRKDLVRIEKKYREKFKAFEAYQVDRPFVYYVSVEKPFLGQDHAQRLYVKIAEALAGMGMALHSAQTQYPNSAGIWTALRSKGFPVKTCDVPGRKNLTGFMLDYR